MDNDFSAIRSIQELKNLLDSGAITPQEYEALKRKIIFGPNGVDTNPTSVTPAASRPIVTDTPVPVPIAGDPIASQYRSEPVVPPNPVPPPPATPLHNTDTVGPEGVNEDVYVEDGKKKDWLLTILITLGVLLLLGLIGYNLFSDTESERLTSASGPDNEEIVADTAAAAEVTTSTRPDRIEVPGDTVAAIPPTPVTTPDTEALPNTTPATEATTTTPAAPSGPPAISEVEALSRINGQLESYYEDMKASPFSAQRHFAPTVERYYTLTNTTPAAINENINTYHFPEFQDSESAIEGGSMKLVSSNADGFEVTYLEHGSAFRKSKGQKQETTARVRAKFDPNFKMTYFRQEALLENKFVE